MKHPFILLMFGLLPSLPAMAGSTPDSRLDSLVGTWKNLSPGAESLKVMISKNPAGELVVQGDDRVSSYTLTCRRKNKSLACAGSGKMRADGQAFIYQNTIKPVGDKLVENWRINLTSSPDGPPVNSGNDKLVRVSGQRQEKKVARADSTAPPRIKDARPPPRPDLPFEISKDVWKVLETSEAYLNQPRQQPLRTRNSYESQLVYTGTKSAALKTPPPKMETTTSEVTPISDRCQKTLQTSPYFAIETYSCGSVMLGSLHNGKPASVIKSLDKLQGSLFPIRVGARFSYRAQSATLLDRNYDSTVTLSCEVVSKELAQELDAQLTGAAWKIRCQSKTTMPNNDNKEINASLDDYYLDDLGARLSDIGVRNMSTKEVVMPTPGTQTVHVVEGEYGSRTTRTYKNHHVAVGESQIAADATEWDRQNAEENRQLAEKEQRLAELRQEKQAREKAAQEQQTAQAELAAQPAYEAPAQASQSAGADSLSALLVEEVVKGAFGQAPTRNRASGNVGEQIVDEFLGQLADRVAEKTGHSPNGRGRSSDGSSGNSRGVTSDGTVGYGYPAGLARQQKDQGTWKALCPPRATPVVGDKGEQACYCLNYDLTQRLVWHAAEKKSEEEAMSICGPYYVPMTADTYYGGSGAGNSASDIGGAGDRKGGGYNSTSGGVARTPTKDRHCPPACAAHPYDCGCSQCPGAPKGKTCGK